MILAEGPEGKREIPIREFFIFVRKTALHQDEIVTAIRVPYHAGSEGVYTKISRRREVDLSTVCATVLRAGDGWRVGLSAPSRRHAHLRLDEDRGAPARGKELGRRDRSSRRPSWPRSEVAPIDDVRATKAYRLAPVVGAGRSPEACEALAK